MSRQEKKNYRKKQVKRQKLAILFVAILVIIVGSIAFGSIFSKAHGNLIDEPVSFKYYKSIEIKQGDSLWSVAEEYKTEQYASTQEYVDELKQLNGLTTDTIHDGQHLMVAYYDTEFK